LRNSQREGGDFVFDGKREKGCSLATR